MCPSSSAGSSHGLQGPPSLGVYPALPGPASHRRTGGNQYQNSGSGSGQLTVEMGCDGLAKPRDLVVVIVVESRATAANSMRKANRCNFTQVR